MYDINVVEQDVSTFLSELCRSRAVTGGHLRHFLGEIDGRKKG